MNSFRDIIGLWPSCEALGADLNENGNAVRKWRLRDSVPPSHWAAVVASANSRGIEGVTLNLMAELASRPRKRVAA